MDSFRTKLEHLVPPWLENRKSKGFPMGPCCGPFDSDGECSMGPILYMVYTWSRLGVYTRGP